MPLENPMGFLGFHFVSIEPFFRVFALHIGLAAFWNAKPITSSVQIEFIRLSAGKRPEWLNWSNYSETSEYVPMKRIYPLVPHTFAFVTPTYNSALLACHMRHAHTHNRKSYRLKCIENQFRICDVQS